MIWHIWWLAIVGFAGMIITWIVKSFDEDVDYYVPVAEIEKLENQHFDEITKAGLKNGNRYFDARDTRTNTAPRCRRNQNLPDFGST